MLIATAFTFWWQWAKGDYERQERPSTYILMKHDYRERFKKEIHFRWVCYQNCKGEKE